MVEKNFNGLLNCAAHAEDACCNSNTGNYAAAAAQQQREQLCMTKSSTHAATRQQETSAGQQLSSLHTTVLQLQMQLQARDHQISSLQNLCAAKDKRVQRLLAAAAINNSLITGLQAQHANQKTLIKQLESTCRLLEEHKFAAERISMQYEDKASRCDEAIASLAECRLQLWELEFLNKALRDAQADSEITQVVPGTACPHQLLHPQPPHLQTTAYASASGSSGATCCWQQTSLGVLQQRGPHVTSRTDLDSNWVVLDVLSGKSDTGSVVDASVLCVASNSCSVSDDNSDTRSTQTESEPGRCSNCSIAEHQPLTGFDVFKEEVRQHGCMAACLAEVTRAAGWSMATACMVDEGITTVAAVLQQTMATPFAKLSCTSAAVQQLVHKLMAQDPSFNCAHSADSIARKAAEALFGMPSTDSVIEEDPLSFAAAAAIMAADGPILDPARVQLAVRQVQTAVGLYAHDLASLFAAVRPIML